MTSSSKQILKEDIVTILEEDNLVIIEELVDNSKSKDEPCLIENGLFVNSEDPNVNQRL